VDLIVQYFVMAKREPAKRSPWRVTIDAHGKSYETTITVSHLEIYNEELQDLLNDNHERIALFSEKSGVYVKGLREIVVQNATDIFKILEKSCKKRKVASTKLNKQSSRSHCIFTITIRMKESAISSGADDFVKKLVHLI